MHTEIIFSPSRTGHDRHSLSDEVKRAAALKFSMGRITMPHQLARLVLTEQIYRACTINAGMKYHK